MAFDEANFRKLAKEAKYSDEEIDAYIAKQSNVNTATGQQFGEAGQKAIDEKAQELRNAGSPVPGTEAPAEQTSTLSKLFDWIKTPAGTAAVTGAGIGLGELARKGVLSRKTTPEISTKIEPTFNQLPEIAAPAPQAPAPVQQPTFTGNAQPTTLPTQQGYGATTMNAPAGVPGPAVPPAAAAPAPVAPTAAPAPVDPLQAARIRKAEAEAAIAEHKLQQLQAGPKTVSSGKSATPGFSEADIKMVESGGAASASKALEAQKIASSVAPTPDPIATTATPVEKAAAVETVAKETQKPIEGKTGAAVKPEMSAAGKTAMEKFGAQYPDVAAQLAKEGKVGLLGFGSGDISLYNTYGAEGRKAVLEHFNKGQPLGPHDPNYENLMSQVRKGVPASEVPGLMAQLPSEAEAGNYGKAEFGKPASINPEGKLIQGKNQVNKLLKAGGPAVLMMALADAAKAETPKERQQAIGNALLGLLPPGADIGEAGAPTLSREQRAKQEEIALLGSPFYNTQAAKNIRQAKKVGAGRGIAPPSAYQR